MNGVADTLGRLAHTFAVRDIMVRAEDLDCGEDTATALQLLDLQPSYDVIPIKHNGELVAYVQRGRSSSRPIRVEDLISDATPILDLASLLSQAASRFVLSGSRIAGYVHFSDLNNQVVKIPYFVLLEAVESRIVSAIGDRITEVDLDTVLGDRADRVKQRMQRLSKSRADRGYVHCLYFGEMLSFACHYGLLALGREEIELITSVRNRIDHADRPLIESQRDAAKLVRTHEICTDILDQLALTHGDAL